MSNIGENLLSAIKDKYNANIKCAKATLNIYMTNSVGIGEHPQHLEEMDKLLEEIATNKDKLDVIESMLKE